MNIQQEIKELQAQNPDASYELLHCWWKRKQEYPPVQDYIDGIVKGDQSQIDAYLAACQAVKNKYPKPE